VKKTRTEIVKIDRGVLDCLVSRTYFNIKRFFIVIIIFEGK